MVTPRVLSVYLLVVVGCCREAEDETQAVAFGGIEGRALVRAGSPCEGGGKEALPAVGLVRIRSGPTVVQEAALAADGTFSLQIPSGSYDLELAVLTAAVDRSLRGLTIEDQRGYRITRVYDPLYGDSMVLFLYDPSVPSERIREILRSESLTPRLQVGANAYYAEVPPGLHPQLEAERIDMAYTEIVGFELNLVACAG